MHANKHRGTAAENESTHATEHPASSDTGMLFRQNQNAERIKEWRGIFRRYTHLVLRVNARELQLRLLEAAVALVVGAHRARNVPPEVEKDVHEVVVAPPLREKGNLDARHHVLRTREDIPHVFEGSNVKR